MAPHTLAYFSYEHRVYPQFDPRQVIAGFTAAVMLPVACYITAPLSQEFRAVAAAHGLVVSRVPQSEHDPVYRADDIEIWEVRRSTAAEDGAHC
jgi:hypothetical protein